MIPSIFIQSINEQMKAFMISVGYTKPFVIASLVSVATNTILGSYVMVDLEMPIYGLPVCSFFRELIILFITLFWWFQVMDSKFKQKVDFEIFNNGLMNFVKQA